MSTSASQDGRSEAVAGRPDVSIIVVSYNTRDLTLLALRSVLEETRQTRFELIVVDNASTDGSADAVAQTFPSIRLIRLKENIGFGRANNRGAVEARGEFILLLNPDTVVLDGAIDRLVAFARARPKARMWGGRTLYGDMSLNATNCYRRMDLWTVFCRVSGLGYAFARSPVFNSETYGGWQRDSEREVDIITGCFLLVERPLWVALGGFDPAFFMYGEEADLCMRALKLGARPRVSPEPTIIHYGGASETVRTEKLVRLFRAKIEVIRRHFSPATRPLAIALFTLWPWSRAVAFSLLVRMRPSPRLTELHGVWSELWRQRRDWLKGYPSASH